MIDHRTWILMTADEAIERRDAMIGRIETNRRRAVWLNVNARA